MIYPFDETGALTSNLVKESRTITSINGVDSNYIIPKAAPFFGLSLVVVDGATGRILDKDIDYELIYKFTTATDAIGRSIYGGFAFINPSVSGTFSIQYQTIGGDWVDDASMGVQDGIDALADLKTILWEEVVPDDLTFPPTRHTQPVTDWEAVTEIIDAIRENTAAISGGSRDILIGDVTDLESGYITPLINAIIGVRDAIVAKENSAYLTHMTKNLGFTATVLSSVAKGVWTDTPLVITVPRTGSWVFNWDVTVFKDNAQFRDFRTRVVINGSVIPQTYAKNVPIAVTAGDIASVEIYLANDNGTLQLSSPDYSSAITAIRLSN